MGLLDKFKSLFTNKKEEEVYEKGLEKTRNEFVNKISILNGKYKKVSNEYFDEFAKDYPNLHIIDWEGYSKEHPEFFYADGIHVKGDGIGAYGKLVYDSIYNDYLNEYRTQKEEMIKKHEEEVNEEYRLLEEENQKMLDTIYDELEKSTHLN